MTEHENDDLSADTAAYALNALSPQERAEVEAALKKSDAMRNEVKQLSDTAALLGLAVEPVKPSADLKANLMAKLGSTPQLPRESDASPQRAESAPAGETGPATTKARTRWFTRPTGILAAAAAAAALFAGGNLVGWNLAHNDFAVTQATALAELQSADDVQSATATVAGGGTAELIWSIERQQSAIVIDELPELPEDRVYQLWYIDGSGATPAGTFEPASQGKTLRVLDGTMSAGDTIGVTVEPEGGSEQPTTDPVVAIPSA
ncbi:MAG TPA: anti-sigma factor [Homoserinimonas sp.]|nr:anti-sigma factor [Homoserinimonas sp.]